jgi:hypothetical protein
MLGRADFDGGNVFILSPQTSGISKSQRNFLLKELFARLKFSPKFILAMQTS